MIKGGHEPSGQGGTVGAGLRGPICECNGGAQGGIEDDSEGLAWVELSIILTLEQAPGEDLPVWEEAVTQGSGSL